MGLIAHLYKVQSGSRGGRIGLIAVPRSKYAAKPVAISLSPAHGNQASGNVAHHVIEECIGLDIEVNQISVPGHLNIMNISIRGFRLATHGPETTKVVLTE